ncbi:low molecular weight protein-tyrosine-phosphatase [Kocuria sp. SL71]|uniref:low molecular weight protein-tyrosine-phosphatase n=1 Tax=Kocuria sp. SL71 TaxID=2995151 RepID=UPI002DD42776|nr:low molecular weight protein-tyrosine-phosphatase [Kocuria sp. SL71]
MYRIAVVCTGNICRSPMAELALERELDRAGLASSVEVDSGGISDEEHGNPVDPRAARVLEREGLDPSGHSARQVTPQWFQDHDLLLAMTPEHARALRAMAPEGAQDRVRLYRSFDPQAADLPESEQGVADPWYGGAEGFESTWEMVVDALPGIVEHAANRQGPEACRTSSCTWTPRSPSATPRASPSCISSPSRSTGPTSSGSTGAPGRARPRWPGSSRRCCP